MALRAGHFAASRLRASGDFLLLPTGGQRALAMTLECGHAWSTAVSPTGGQRALAMFSERMPTPAPRPVGAYPTCSRGSK